MSDLISRSALIAEYDRVHVGPPGGARKLMEDAPAIDAVEVDRKTAEECLRVVEEYVNRTGTMIMVHCAALGKKKRFEFFGDSR